MAKQRLRRAAAGLAAALAVALVAAGCGSSGTGTSSSSASSGGKVTLTVWSWVAGLQQEANAYMKEHPNVTVKVVNVGGANSISRALRATIAAAGVCQRCSWISPSSTTTGG